MILPLSRLYGHTVYVDTYTYFDLRTVVREKTSAQKVVQHIVDSTLLRYLTAAQDDLQMVRFKYPKKGKNGHPSNHYAAVQSVGFISVFFKHWKQRHNMIKKVSNIPFTHIHYSSKSLSIINFDNYKYFSLFKVYQNVVLYY